MNHGFDQSSQQPQKSQRNPNGDGANQLSEPREIVERNQHADETGFGVSENVSPTQYGSTNSQDPFSHPAREYLSSEETLDSRDTVEPGVRQYPDWSGMKIGKYQLTRQLASGGSGVVYEAKQDAPVERIVALKLLMGASFEGQSRWATETRAMAGLRHPAIVQIIEAGVAENGIHYLVMPLIDGERIDVWVQMHKSDPRAIAKLMLEIAHAMEHAHSKGILHRDLKPGNILVTHDGQPVVTDFGLAKRFAGPTKDHTTQSGVVIGSFGFMAPEQLCWSVSSSFPPIDVYGFGATLYRLLTGVPPIRASKFQEAVDDLVNREPLAVRKLNRQVPKDLQSICAKCLEKEPAQRYQSMAEVAAELQHFLHDLPIHARPIGRVQRLARWTRRDPVVAALATALGLLLLASTITFGLLWRSAEKSHQRDQRHLQVAIQIIKNEAEEAEKYLMVVPGSLDYRIQRLESAIDFLKLLVDENPHDLNVQGRLAVAYFLAGKVPKHEGREQERRKAFQKAIEIYESILEKKQGDPDARFGLFHALLALGCLDGAVDIDQRLVSHWRALKTIEDLAANYPENPDYQDALACQLQLMASAYSSEENLESRNISDNLAIRAFATAKAVVDNYPERPSYLKHVVSSLRVLSLNAKSDGDISEARQLNERSLNTAEKLVAMQPEIPENWEMLAQTYSQAALWALLAEDFEAGRQHQQEAIMIIACVVDRFPEFTAFKSARENIERDYHEYSVAQGKGFGP